MGKSKVTIGVVGDEEWNKLRNSQSQIQAADVVLLRRSQAGQSAGFHLVRSVEADGRMTVLSLATGETFQALAADVVWVGANRLPFAAVDVTLAPRPQPKVAAALPPPEPLPRLVKVYVVNGKPEYQITRPRQSLRVGLKTVSYKPTGNVITDRNQQPHREYLVDVVDQGRFLQIDGSYLPGQESPELQAALRTPEFTEEA